MKEITVGNRPQNIPELTSSSLYEVIAPTKQVGEAIIAT